MRSRLASRRDPRRTATAKGGPHGLPFALFLACALAAVCVGSTAASAAGPAPAVFRQGYDLCRVAPLRAVRAAGGERYRAGLFAAGICTWERRDLKAGITLSTHPPSVGAELMTMFLARKQPTRKIAVPGAIRALLVTAAAGAHGATSKILFASYPDGTIQIGMTAPHGLADARLLAVLRLVAPA